MSGHCAVVWTTSTTPKGPCPVPCLDTHTVRQTATLNQIGSVEGGRPWLTFCGTMQGAEQHDLINADGCPSQIQFFNSVAI